MDMCKNDRPSKPHIRDIKIKWVQIFNHLDRVVTDDGKPNAHINNKRCLSESKQNIKAQEDVVRNEANILNCYVISTLGYGNECEPIVFQMKYRLEATEMWFYRWM